MDTEADSVIADVNTSRNNQSVIDDESPEQRDASERSGREEQCDTPPLMRRLYHVALVQIQRAHVGRACERRESRRSEDGAAKVEGCDTWPTVVEQPAARHSPRYSPKSMAVMPGAPSLRRWPQEMRRGIRRDVRLVSAAAPPDSNESDAPRAVSAGSRAARSRAASAEVSSELGSRASTLMKNMGHKSRPQRAYT